MKKVKCCAMKKILAPLCVWAALIGPSFTKAAVSLSFQTKLLNEET
jgi:hypothetical protein